MGSEEKRLQERFPVQIEARLAGEGDTSHTDKEYTITGTALNISSGGTFICTSTQFPLASRLHLKFLISYEQLKKLRFILSYESLRQICGKDIWITVTGVVIRNEEDGMGIIFDKDYQLSPVDGEIVPDT